MPVLKNDFFQIGDKWYTEKEKSLYVGTRKEEKRLYQIGESSEVEVVDIIQNKVQNIFNGKSYDAALITIDGKFMTKINLNELYDFIFQ